MRKSTFRLLVLLSLAPASSWGAAAEPLRIICFGAHPDDCELQIGGTAAMWAAKGHKVKFVSLTNGDIGHWREAGGPLAKRRFEEVQKAAQILGVTTEVLDIHDGELMPTVENRRTLTRLIRQWKADVVIGHRPNDYHPDHRYTGVLVQDAAYMVTVPFFCPDVPHLTNNPVFMYYPDRFQKPNPFDPSVVVDITSVIEKKLEALAPGLELVKDYGWLTILAKPLYWLLDKLHGFLHNWGWSIVALVLLLKIAFYWLNAKAYASMAKMKAINPKIMEMRERLKDKPQEMQQAMMKIYREEKVNPMGGCFPIMIQIPVFIALYWVLLSSVEMRNAPWVLWIHDLSAPDPFFILPVLMTLTTMLQTALNPAPPDPMQAKLMWFMPLIFSVMFFFFPAGLVLYWITNNILSITQQWLINTRMGVPPEFNLPKFK